MQIKSDPISGEQLLQLEELLAGSRNFDSGRAERILNIIDRSPVERASSPRFIVTVSFDSEREGDGRLELLLDAFEIMGVRRTFRVVP